MDFASLFREFGPVFVVCWLAWGAGPSLIKSLSTIGTERFQTQNTIMLFSAQSVNRLLDQTEAERQRNQAAEQSFVVALNDVKAQLQVINTNVNMIIDHLLKGDLE